jgi:uncharacterized membrane protein
MKALLGRWRTIRQGHSGDTIPRSLGARILLAAGICGYVAFYLWWSIRNFDNFGMYGFDLGIHDQAVWLLSRGHNPFVTISGTNYFGDHLSWIMVVLVPLYWLFPSVKVLLVAQSLALGLAALPAFLVIRSKLRSEWLACGLAWVYLLNPYIGWAHTEQFHPDVFEVALVFLAFLFVLRKRWRLFLTMVVLLMLIKEDVPLLVFGLGVWVAVLFNRRVGAFTAALSVVWMFVNFRFLLPALSGTGSLAEYVRIHGSRIPFGGLGGFARTLVTRPWEVASKLFDTGRPRYYLQVFAPLAFVPFLSPSTLAAVILPLLVNGLSTFGYQHMINYHYGTLVVPGLLVAAAFGVVNVPRRLRTVLVGLMLLMSVVGLWLWGPVPGSRDPEVWMKQPASFSQTFHEAVDLIPDNAVVSADYHFVTQVAHRVEVYEFPNPWFTRNWGSDAGNGQELPERVARVEYVLASSGAESRSRDVLERIMESGEFATIFEREGILVLKRVKMAEPAGVEVGAAGF